MNDVDNNGHEVDRIEKAQLQYNQKYQCKPVFKKLQSSTLEKIVSPYY